MGSPLRERRCASPFSSPISFFLLSSILPFVSLSPSFPTSSKANRLPVRKGKTRPLLNSALPACGTSATPATWIRCCKSSGETRLPSRFTLFPFPSSSSPSGALLSHGCVCLCVCVTVCARVTWRAIVLCDIHFLYALACLFAFSSSLVLLPHKVHGLFLFRLSFFQSTVSSILIHFFSVSVHPSHIYDSYLYDIDIYCMPHTLAFPYLSLTASAP